MSRSGNGHAPDPTPTPPPADDRLQLALSILFSEEEVDVLRAIGTGDLSAEVLAHKLGRQAPDNGLRKLLSNLVKRGVLESLHAGYRLTNKKFLDFLPPL